MKQNSSISLFRQIQRLVLPKLLLLVLFFVVAISAAFIVIGENQIRKQHLLLNNQLTSNIDSNIKNLVNTVEGLSQNDLLINGLIDFQMRDEYLPLFFQSLKLGNTQQSTSALFDFSGALVQSNRWDDAQVSAFAPNWRNTVFEQGETFLLIGKFGVLVIAPIKLSGLPEGALGVYINDLQPFINFKTDELSQYIVDSNGDVVFLSDGTKQAPLHEGSLPKRHFTHRYEYNWRSFTVISIQSFKSSYSQSLWLLPFLLLAILASLLTGIIAVHLAAKKASVTLRAMHHSLQKSVQGNDQHQIADENEAFELQGIRLSFYELLDQLLSLSLNNDKITNVINSLKELLIVVDHEGQVLLSNTAGDEYFKYSELSKHDLINRALKGLSNNKELFFTTTAMSKEKRLTINWTVLPFTDNKGSQIGAILNGEDVSLTMSLKDDINLRNQAMQESPAAISISDISLPGSPLIYVNQAFCDTTGYGSDEALGQNCKFLQGEDTSSEAVATIRQAIAAREACSVVLTNYKKDGTAFINSLALKPVFEKDGQVRFYVGVQQDITTEKQTEKYLAQAKDKAEDMAKAQARFFAGINHELRTPINGINGLIKALLNSPLSETQRNQLNLANQSASNLLLLVNDVLDYSKAESGQLSIDSKDFNVKTLFDDLAASYELQCKQKQLAFEWSNKPEQDTFIKGDKLRLQQVIDNLFNNALKFTDAGSISITSNLSDLSEPNNDKHSEGQQQKLTIRVQDSGVGIRADQTSKIFEKFGQVQSSTRKVTSGTGLGLNISKQLIKLMGGELGLKSEYGQGSVFDFYVVVETAQSHEQSAAISALPSNIAKLDPVPVVLIVEDNDINQQVVLANLPDTKNLVAANGLIALDILNKAKINIDIILMDCQMPELDGWDTTRLIRSGHAGDKYKNIPVIALTAYTSLQDQQQCEQAGMNDYVSKPFDPSQLLTKVEHWTLVSRQNKAQVATDLT